MTVKVGFDVVVGVLEEIRRELPGVQYELTEGFASYPPNDKNPYGCLVNQVFERLLHEAWRKTCIHYPFYGVHEMVEHLDRKKVATFDSLASSMLQRAQEIQDDEQPWGKVIDKTFKEFGVRS